MTHSVKNYRNLQHTKLYIVESSIQMVNDDENVRNDSVRETYWGQSWCISWRRWDRAADVGTLSDGRHDVIVVLISYTSASRAVSNVKIIRLICKNVYDVYYYNTVTGATY